jgi:hypothetical protein
VFKACNFMGIVTSDGSKHIVKDNLDEDFIEVKAHVNLTIFDSFNLYS